MPSNDPVLSHSLLLLPSIFPSIRVFSNESVLRIRWPKHWSFNFSFSPSNEYSELISFRIDWVDLLAARGTLKSLLQHHSSKASILQCSAFLMVQLFHPYTTTGKTIALTILTFVGKVISLIFVDKEMLFNTLSRFVTTFLPRSKCLLISWLRLPSARILKVKGKLLSHVHLFMTPWTVTHQASPSLRFPRQEYWSGLSFPSPGDLPHPGIEPGSPSVQANSLLSGPQEKLKLAQGAGVVWGDVKWR